MENILSKINYFIALRESQSERIAIQELEDGRNEQVSPVWSLRGNDNKSSLRFAEAWSGGAYWLDSSRFPQDMASTVAAKLNDPASHFANKAAFFAQINEANPNALPVIGFQPSDPSRSVTQFGLHMLATYPMVALRLELSGNHLSQRQTLARSFLDAVTDKDLSRLVLLVDYGAIDRIPNTAGSSSWADVKSLITQFGLRNVVTLSTSWPEDRPERGYNRSVPCIDPYWQAFIHDELERMLKVNAYYGDYGSTNPTRDIADDYKPGIMSAPIPYAGYFAPYEWYQERRGRSGENEQFRDIANHIMALDHYQMRGSNFSWGTKQIAEIATGARDTPGNVSHWNKIRVNQHATEMLELLQHGALQEIVRDAFSEESEDEDL